MLFVVLGLLLLVCELLLGSWPRDRLPDRLLDRLLDGRVDHIERR